MSGKEQRKSILVVVDPTADEQPALARAAWLAKAMNAVLELFVCHYEQQLAALPPFDPRGLEEARGRLLQEHVARLEAMAQPLIEQGLTVTVDARLGRPLHRCIIRKVSESRPTLVVKDGHHHAVLKRTILSNTDWSLIQSCPAPLHLVQARAVGTPPKILAAVDPMHEHDKPAALDHSILTFARELARDIDGELHVLHAFDMTAVLAASSATTPIGMASLPVAELTAAFERNHREALRKLLADFPVAPANIHFDEGAPNQCIARTAREQSMDFVVMGAVSRSGLQRIFVGSTAERTMDRLPCDLIVIKPPGFEAETD